jgi:RNA polymerase sigma factor (sigma-70 family)
MANWSTFDPETDRRLVTSLNEGDEGTFATLYDQYAERLYDYCLSLARQPRSAADIVHDTFIDALRRAPRMRNRGRLRSWLYAAARRRCLQRIRTHGRQLQWDWSGETATGTDPGTGLPISELRSILEGAMQRLDFADQEMLLLALRHEVTGEDLAAVLGVPVRRANGQVARAWSLGESAVAGEVLARCGRYSAEHPGDDARRLDLMRASPDELADHAAECPACRPYLGISVSALLTVPPVPVVPAGLRHRVMHTGTDSELAGYRAEIAARGGLLNADGMPRQPDVPSPMARRWIFTAGGVAGALLSALVAALIIGPSLPNTEIEWPWQHDPPTGSPPSKGQRIHPPVRQPGAQPGEADPANPTDPADPANPMDPMDASPVVPQLDGHTTTKTPTPKATPDPSPQPIVSGELVIAPPAVALRVGQEGYFELSAVHGPVTWSAATSTGQLQLAVQQGAIPTNRTYKMKVTLKRWPLQLPGQAVITFTGPDGRPQNVQVTWALSLL